MTCAHIQRATIVVLRCIFSYCSIQLMPLVIRLFSYFSSQQQNDLFKSITVTLVLDLASKLSPKVIICKHQNWIYIISEFICSHVEKLNLSDKREANREASLILGEVSICRCNFLLASHFYFACLVSNVAALQDTAIDIVCLILIPIMCINTEPRH